MTGARVGGPRSQPYEYLAAHYVRIGQPEEATTIWYAREREQRKEAGVLLRFWGVVQDVTLGYGWIFVTTVAAAAARVLQRG